MGNSIDTQRARGQGGKNAITPPAITSLYQKRTAPGGAARSQTNRGTRTHEGVIVPPLRR